MVRHRVTGSGSVVEDDMPWLPPVLQFSYLGDIDLQFWIPLELGKIEVCEFIAGAFRQHLCEAWWRQCDVFGLQIRQVFQAALNGAHVDAVENECIDVRTVQKD